MAQVLLQGTNFVNFMGRFVYVAGDHSLEAVVATERNEPQAVFGSTLHKVAFPKNYQNFVSRGRELKEFYEHKGNPRVLQMQLRGEYAYVAAGEAACAFTTSRRSIRRDFPSASSLRPSPDSARSFG